MLAIKEMSSDEVLELLDKIGYGHLGCINNAGKPHVIPMQYYLKERSIYIFTDQGKKSDEFDRHPDICLQVEELQDTENWSSVVIDGRVERLTERSQIEEIANFIKQQNPTLSPVLNQQWNDLSEIENKIAFYRIESSEMTGSKTSGTNN